MKHHSFDQAGIARQRHWNLASSQVARPAPHSAVILLHGLFATHRSMRRLEFELLFNNFIVINWRYSSFLKTIEQHASRLSDLIQQLDADNHVDQIHFLTHSMGGIVARCALHAQDFQKVSRMVMLAPPNAGSHLTRYSLGPFRRLLPAVAQLSESPDSLPNSLVSPSRLEIGVIAASADRIVKVANTHLPGQAEHRTVNTSHLAIPKHPDVIPMCVRFLRHGAFSAGCTFSNKPAFSNTQGKLQSSSFNRERRAAA